MSAIQALSERRLRLVEKADNLCASCQSLTDDKMLCPGIRPWVDEDAQIAYGRVIVIDSPCWKYRLKQAGSRTERLLASSGIPINYQIEREELPTAASQRSLEEHPIPTLVCSSYAPSFRKEVWDLGIAACKQGIQFKAVHLLALFSKYTAWTSIIDDFGDCPILFLDRYDMGNAPNYIIDLVVELVRYRIDRGRTTIVATGGYAARTPAEAELIEDMKSWTSSLQ